MRYVDDFLLFGATRAELHEARARVERFLVTLRLTLHPKKTRVLPVRSGVPFLGFVVRPGNVRIKADAVRRFVRRLRHHRRAGAGQAVPVARLSESVRSWVAHASYGQTYRLRTHLFLRLAL